MDDADAAVAEEEEEGRGMSDAVLDKTGWTAAGVMMEVAAEDEQAETDAADAPAWFTGAKANDELLSFNFSNDADDVQVAEDEEEEAEGEEEQAKALLLELTLLLLLLTGDFFNLSANHRFIRSFKLNSALGLLLLLLLLEMALLIFELLQLLNEFVAATNREFVVKISVTRCSLNNP